RRGPALGRLGPFGRFASIPAPSAPITRARFCRAMFVEITRLLIVLLATGGGFSIARASTNDAGGMAVLGAVLGALFGYVVGGVMARLLRRAMGRVEDQVDRTPPAQLLGGGLGAALLGGISLMVGIPAVVLMPGLSGWPVLGLL